MKRTILSTVAGLAALAAVAAEPTVFQIRLVVDTPSADSETMTNITGTAGHTYTNVLQVQKAVLLDQSALKSAKPGKDNLGNPILDIAMTEAGAKQFAVITRQHLHERLAIVVNGQLCEAPMVQSEIPGGLVEITGNFSSQEIRDLAKKLNTAAGKK
jgi:preprotein translocase subunit SecD